MQRICIAVPTITDFYFTRHRHTSLGARITAELFREKRIEVTFLDFCAGASKMRQTPLPESISYLKPLLIDGERGALSFFTGYKRLGPLPDRQAEAVEETQPDAVLLASFSFAYAEDAIALAAAIRTRLPGVPIVAGGAGPSVHPGYYLDDSAIDTVVAGSAEANLSALLTALNMNRCEMPGIISEDDSEKPPIRFVSAIRHGSLSTLVSRGCPKQCRFCSIHLTEGRGHRRLEPADLAAGFERLKQAGARHIRAINFEDDNLLYDESYLRRILDVTTASFPDLEIRAENGLDPEYATDHILELLAASGMSRLNLSLAIHHQAAARGERRHPVAGRLPHIVHRAGELGMGVTVYWICGLESDTPQSVIETLHFIASLGCSSGVSPYYPVPGLSGFEDMRLFSRPNAIRTKGSSLYPWNRSLTTIQMITTFRLSRFLNLRVSPEGDRELYQSCLRDKWIYTIDRTGERMRVPEELLDAEMVGRFFEGL